MYERSTFYIKRQRSKSCTCRHFGSLNVGFAHQSEKKLSQSICRTVCGVWVCVFMIHTTCLTFQLRPFLEARCGLWCGLHVIMLLEFNWRAWSTQPVARTSRIVSSLDTGHSLHKWGNYCFIFHALHMISDSM